METYRLTQATTVLKRSLLKWKPMSILEAERKGSNFSGLSWTYYKIELPVPLFDNK